MSMRRVSKDVLELWSDMDECAGIEYGAAARELARRELARANRAERRYLAKRDAREERLRVAKLHWSDLGAWLNAADHDHLRAQLAAELPTMNSRTRREAMLVLDLVDNG